MSDNDRDTGTRDRAEGTGNELKGRVKQGIGGLTGDREQQSEGMADETKGNIQQGIGDIKDKLSDKDR